MEFTAMKQDRTEHEFLTASSSPEEQILLHSATHGVVLTTIR